MITDLRNPTLKQRHWDTIYDTLDYRFTAEDPITLGKLVEIEAFRHTEAIEEISGQASSEASLEAILKKVDDSWKAMEFPVLPYKDIKDVFILGGTDEIQVLLDDSNINVATIASSRHVGPIKSRVDDWGKQLELFNKTLVCVCFMWINPLSPMSAIRRFLFTYACPQERHMVLSSAVAISPRAPLGAQKGIPQIATGFMLNLL